MELRAIGDWLLEKDAQAQNALRYYLGPAYEPINALAQFGALMSPGADMMDMAQSSDALMHSPTWKDAGLNALGLGAATLGMAIPGTARGVTEAVEAGVRPFKSLSDVRDAVGKYDDVFVRWSKGPDYDLKPGAVSRDYQSGATHAGLSAMPLSADLTDADLARHLRSYDYLTDLDRNPTAGHIYRGRRVGLDSDGSPVIAPSEYLGPIDPELHGYISSDDALRRLEIESEISRFRDALKYYETHPQPFGSPYSQEGLTALEEMLKRLGA